MLEPAPISSSAAASGSGCTPTAMLVVDDHDLLRLGVRALVQSQAPHALVFEAGTLADALALYGRHDARIRLVLLDLALPDTQGLSGLAEFRRRFPAARVVVLSGTASASLARDALALGASAFLPKSADLKEMACFIRECSVLGADAAAEGPVERDRADARRQLTPRQAQVLQWVLEGKANKEIAQLANLSEGTVKNHVSTLLLVFGMRSRAQLISSLH